MALADMPTLLDIAQQSNEDGTPATIAEILMEQCPLTKRLPWFPTNKEQTNLTPVRVGLTTPSIRRVNEGVTPSKPQTASIEEGCTMLEDWSVIDELNFKITGYEIEHRINFGKGHIQGLGHEMERLFVYAKRTDNAAYFDGLDVRYGSKSGNTAKNVLSAGGSSNANTSIYLIAPGKDSVHGLYPKNMMAGLEHEDLGKSEEFDGDGTPGGKRFMAWKDRWSWAAGLGIPDYQQVVRIGDIDSSAMLAQSGTQDITAYQTHVLYHMIRATHRLGRVTPGTFWLMGRSAAEALDVSTAILAQQNITRSEDAEQGRILRFRGFPILVSDALVYNEANLAA